MFAVLNLGVHAERDT